MPQPSPTTRAAWWPALTIFGAACAFCWPVFLGRVMLPADMCLWMIPWSALRDQFPPLDRIYNPMFDPIQQYLPWRIYAVDSLRAWFVPLWNPYAFCGTPFLANLQSTLLYPPNLLFLLTGARHGFGISAILHLTLGGLFTYGFLRTLDLRRPAAVFGALVVMCNGYTVTWLEYPTLSLWVFMWLPAMLLCYERSLRHPGWRWPALTALAVGLQFLGGHLQVSGYVMIAFLIYALVRVASPGSGQLGRSRAVAAFIVPVVLGLALAAGQILPTVELAGHSGRVSHGAALSTAFPLTHLVLYLIPNFFGNPVDYNYWGNYRDQTGFNYFETACYVGILPLLLAAWSLRRWRERSFWFFAVLTGFAVLAAVGSPVYLLLYYLGPGFRELAGLGRVLSLAGFGLAGLAGVGLDDLLSGAERRRVRGPLLLGAGLLVAAAAAIALFQPVMAALDPAWEFPRYLARQMAALLCLTAAAVTLILLRARLRIGSGAFAALSVALVGVDLFFFGIRFNPFTDARMAYPQTDSTRWLQEHADHERFTSLASHGLDWMPHNAPMIFGLRDVHGSDSLRVRRSFDLVSPPGTDQASYPDPSSPLLEALGVRYLMTKRQVPEPWKLGHDGEAPIYENRGAMPRAYLVHEVAPAEDVQALAALRVDWRWLQERALAEPGDAARMKGAIAPAASGGKERVDFLTDGADAITLKAAASSSALLVLTDSYYPGWRARVDGKPAAILRVNYAFRGVPVPAGEHTVELRYEPASFRVGLFLSLLALCSLGAGLGARCSRKRPRAAAPAARS